MALYQHLQTNTACTLKMDTHTHSLSLTSVWSQSVWVIIAASDWMINHLRPATPAQWRYLMTGLQGSHDDVAWWSTSTEVGLTANNYSQTNPIYQNLDLSHLTKECILFTNSNTNHHDQKKKKKNYYVREKKRKNTAWILARLIPSSLWSTGKKKGRTEYILLSPVYKRYNN
jgi:hypothetical protein